MCSIPVHTHLIREPNFDLSKITNSIKYIFEQIYLNMDSVQFPSNWCRLVPGNNKSVIYSKILLRESDLKPYFERSVSIDEKATIKCSYMNDKIPFSHLKLNSNLIQNIQELEEVICKMDSSIMCKGVNIPTEALKYKTNTLCIDSNGHFRHIGCSLILIEEFAINRLNDNKIIRQCKFCKVPSID
jgi:hypothetical protein